MSRSCDALRAELAQRDATIGVLRATIARLSCGNVLEMSTCDLGDEGTHGIKSYGEVIMRGRTRRSTGDMRYMHAMAHDPVPDAAACEWTGDDARSYVTLPACDGCTSPQSPPTRAIGVCGPGKSALIEDRRGSGGVLSWLRRIRRGTLGSSPQLESPMPLNTDSETTDAGPISDQTSSDTCASPDAEECCAETTILCCEVQVNVGVNCLSDDRGECAIGVATYTYAELRTCVGSIPAECAAHIEDHMADEDVLERLGVPRAALRAIDAIELHDRKYAAGLTAVQLRRALRR